MLHLQILPTLYSFPGYDSNYDKGSNQLTGTLPPELICLNKTVIDYCKLYQQSCIMEKTYLCSTQAKTILKTYYFLQMAMISSIENDNISSTKAKKLAY